MAVDLTGREVADDIALADTPRPSGATPEDMVHFDRLPQWARELLNDSVFKTKASEVGPAIFSGAVHRGNGRAQIRANDARLRAEFGKANA